MLEDSESKFLHADKFLEATKILHVNQQLFYHTAEFLYKLTK